MNILDTYITEHFKFSEALFLKTWGIYVYPDTQDVWTNIQKTADVLELIRSIIGKPLHITSWYRPEKYNIMIGGAHSSMHVLGLAADFHCDGISCDEVRAILLPHLHALDIRMEAGDAQNRVHIDLKRDVKLSNENRVFKP